MSEIEPWLRIGSGDDPESQRLTEAFRKQVLANQDIAIDVLNNSQTAELELPEDLEVSLRRRDHVQHKDTDYFSRSQRVLAGIAIWGTVHDLLDRSEDGRNIELDPKTMSHFEDMLVIMRESPSVQSLSSLSSAYKKYTGPEKKFNPDDYYRLTFRIIGQLKLRSFTEMMGSHSSQLAESELHSGPINSATQAGVA